MIQQHFAVERTGSTGDRVRLGHVPGVDGNTAVEHHQDLTFAPEAGCVVGRGSFDSAGEVVAGLDYVGGFFGAGEPALPFFDHEYRLKAGHGGEPGAVDLNSDQRSVGHQHVAAHFGEDGGDDAGIFSLMQHQVQCVDF